MGVYLRYWKVALQQVVIHLQGSGRKTCNSAAKPLPCLLSTTHSMLAETTSAMQCLLSSHMLVQTAPAMQSLLSDHMLTERTPAMQFLLPNHTASLAKQDQQRFCFSESHQARLNQVNGDLDYTKLY